MQLCSDGLEETGTGPHAPADISALDMSAQLSKKKHAGSSLLISPDAEILLFPKEPYSLLPETSEMGLMGDVCCRGRRVISQLPLRGVIAGGEDAAIQCACCSPPPQHMSLPVTLQLVCWDMPHLGITPHQSFFKQAKK